MTEDQPHPADPEAARQLRDLALDFAARSHAAQAALVRAFESEAAGLAAAVGELAVNDDDDEHLVLTTEGRFSGRVHSDIPGVGWQAIESPDDVAENYDPVDLFSDVADALGDAFPELEAGDAEAEPPTQAAAPVEASTPDGGAPAAAPESATLRSLESLRDAGVLSQADFEARRAQLRQ